MTLKYLELCSISGFRVYILTGMMENNMMLAHFHLKVTTGQRNIYPWYLLCECDYLQVVPEFI